MIRGNHGLEVLEHSEAFSLQDNDDIEFSHTKVILRSANEWYYAITHQRFKSTHDIKVASLDPIRMEPARLWPPNSSEFTQASPPDSKNVYVKRPCLLDYGDTEASSNFAALLLHEARICERLRANSHPHVARYHGVVAENNVIVGLCFTRYNMTLSQRLKDARPFDRKRFWEQLRSGVSHLHHLGYVHNDINPQNIMVRDDEPVIIDFDSCQREGQPIGAKGGTEGWEKKDMHTAERENDVHALAKIRSILFE